MIFVIGLGLFLVSMFCINVLGTGIKGPQNAADNVGTGLFLVGVGAMLYSVCKLLWVYLP